MRNRIVCALLVALCLVVACNRDPNAAKKKYVENGNKYFDRGKYKEAVIMYSNALKRDMKYGEAYYRRALAQLKLQRVLDAARDLQRAVELQPENLDAINRLTNLYLNAYLGDARRPKFLVTELKQLEERYAKQFPGSYEEARLKGYLALFDNKLEDALGLFAKANQLKPNQQDLVLVYMQTMAATNRSGEAEKLAQEMLAKDPGALAIYDALFLLYARQNKQVEAENVLKAKIDKNPKVDHAYIGLATYYYSAKRRDDMMKTLQRITANQQDFPKGPLTVGDFFIRAREYDLAAEQYLDGIKRNSKDKATYQKRMVEVLVKQNKREEAVNMIAEVLKADPKDAEAMAIRASLNLLTGTREQLQSAIDDLQTVVSKIPDNPVLRYNLGRAHMAKGNAQAARVQYEEAIKLRPDYLLPRIALAQIYLQNNEFGKVVPMAQEILLYDSTNVAGRLLRSRALMGLGDMKQARAELMQTAQMYPDLAEARLQIAALDLQDKNFKAAEDAFRKLYVQSQDPRALMGLVESQMSQQQPAVAVKTLRDEIAKNPNRLEYRVALGNVSVNLKDYATAAGEYKAVLEKLPRNTQVWMQLGETYRRAGDLGQAVVAFKKAQEISPADFRPAVQLALIYDTSGQKDNARPMYEQVLRLQPDHPIALNNLAFMMAETGTDLDQALTMAQKATQQRPNDNDIADTLGWIYMKKNLPDSAIGIFRRIIEQTPDRPLYRYHLAMALAQKGDKVSAKKECEMALRAKPPKDEEAKIRQLMSTLG